MSEHAAQPADSVGASSFEEKTAVPERGWLEFPGDALEAVGENAEAMTFALLVAAGILAIAGFAVGLDVLRRGHVARHAARSTFRSLGSSLWLVALVAVAGLVWWRTTNDLDSSRGEATIASSVAETTEVRAGELSDDEVLAEQPEKPPLWVTDPDVSDPNLAVVSSRRFATVDEAEADARAELASLVDRALAERAGVDTGDWTVPPDVAADLAVRRRFVEPITHTTEASEFVVHRVHLEADLDERVLAQVGALYQDEIVRGRLWKLGGLVGFLTVLFATVATCLRLDEATDGNYRGRLEAAAVSLVTAAGLVVAALV